MEIKRHEIEIGKTLNELDLSPESHAFLLYIMRITDGIELPEEEIVFAPIDIKFGVAKAKWATMFVDTDGDWTEYWIIYRDNVATAVVTRYIDADQTMSCAFTQFMLLPINQEGVVELIEQLPKVSDVLKSVLNSHKLH